eukprot:1145207-Pelagomonas_calceolata.AAC.3
MSMLPWLTCNCNLKSPAQTCQQFDYFCALGEQLRPGLPHPYGNSRGKVPQTWQGMLGEWPKQDLILRLWPDAS